MHEKQDFIQLINSRAAIVVIESRDEKRIEQSIVSALYSMVGESGRLTSELLLDEIAATRPLSVVMAEQIAAMRAWAAQRTVQAD